MEISQILNNNQVLTKSEKLDISLKEIAKGLRQQLKKEYPSCKFSITTEYYSMGQSLHISILETNFKIIKPFEELSEVAILSYLDGGFRTREELKSYQETKTHQISEHRFNEVYNPNIWDNGVFLTEEGFNLVKRITELINKFNWDDSDMQTDYFDVKFYTHLNIGRYDKPLIEHI